MEVNRITSLLAKWGCTAVIFDLDGTMLDNNAFHLKAWKEYLHNIGRNMSDEEYNAKINGRTNNDVIKYLYGPDLPEEEIQKHTMDKEAVYRRMYAPFIKPLDGLIPLLEILDGDKIPMAIATSGIKVNIDFMFEHVPVKKFFRKIVDSSDISKGKPDPEVFLKAAEFLQKPPAKCLVFEDAVVGINAAKAAGMKVIAVATTMPKEELKEANLIIDDYRALL